MGYSYTQPVNGAFEEPVSEVRFLLRDTDPKAPFSLTDEEIGYLLGLSGDDPAAAAAKAARRMATGYRKSAVKSKSIGNISLSYDYETAAVEYEGLASELLPGNEDAPTGPIFAPSDPVFGLGQFDNGVPW